MRINSIYIQGFKSFMDKLSIQISPGISAFVGPNGCGKSNIVDAIRWVMGEQSPKQLRGRQMEDLIFSGAGALKPLGMAEVRLTLQNGAGPHDNGEISIGRRLYRSGESEYLINNSQCRLKDIHDLFMDTGLGNRTYSVIAQGEISSVIEQRPEETRLLLEEAAGISKYKARREASLKKISLTKENLRRVEDLLAEISREMNSLKRQAGKARRYKEVSSEIRRLNLVLLAYTYDELQKEKLDIKRLIDDKMKKKEELESLFSESEVIIEEKNLELIGKEKLLTFLRESVFSHRETCRKNEDALQHLAADQERFRQADIRLNKEKEEIGGKLRGFESEINQISSKIGVLGESVQEISSLRSDYDSSFKEQRLLLSRIRDGLEKEKSHLIELTTNEARLTGEIRNLTEVTNHLDTRKDELEKSSKESAQRLEKVTVLLHEKKKEREEVLIQVKSLEKELQKQKIRLLEIEEVKGEKESKRISADSELRLLRSQLKTIRELIESYEGYNSGVRKIMKIYGQKTVKERKILGLLADFIQVEPEFETAVEAVLEDKLQYVIVSKQEHGKEAVEYLRSTNEGRSYFLPIEEFKPEKYPDKGKDKLNGFRLLKDHVSVTEKLKPVVESFLGNAALVENLSQALSAWNNYKGNQILVTPEGDLVDKRGIIIGGRLGEDSIGLLRRRRKEHELGKKIDDQEKLIAISKSELEDIDMNIQEIQNCIDELERNKTAYAQKADKIERDMLFLENDAEQLKRVFQSIADQIGSLGNEKQENKSRLIDLEKRLSERCKERKKMEMVVSEKESKVQELEAALDHLKENLSQALVRYNQCKEEERSLIREKERFDQFISDMRDRAGKIEQEIKSNIDQYGSSLAKEEKLKEDLKVALQEQKALEAKVNECENEFEGLRSELREKEKETGLLRGKINEIREDINEVKIKEAGIDFQIKGILSQASKEAEVNLEKDYKRYPAKDFSKSQYELKLREIIRIKERIGEVNLLAINDYEKLKERYEFIKAQQQDLLASIDSLNTAIRRINMISKAKFLSVFESVNAKLKTVFPILFNGGRARLRLVDENLPLESGVLFEVQPPGKKLVHMGLLSGGEKALAAMALLFAIYLIKPSPFIIMDEVDAPLDEENTGRFNRLLKEIEKSSQVIVVTHNRKTMEQAARLFGVTMDKSRISKIVSVDL